MVVTSVQFINAVLENELGIPPSAYYILLNGKAVEDSDNVEVEHIRICFRVLGGKGGFGSLLKTIGNQIERTTNRGACRDLSGRRLRDIANEKKLKEWLSKAVEREEQRIKRKRERRQRLLQVPKHYFEDQTYFEQKEIVSENLEEAVEVGVAKFMELKRAELAKLHEKQTAPKKRKKSTEPQTAAKRPSFWMNNDDYNDGLNLDDSSSSSDESTGTANKETTAEKTSRLFPPRDPETLSQLSCESCPDFLIGRCVVTEPASPGRNSCSGDYCINWLEDLMVEKQEEKEEEETIDELIDLESTATVDQLLLFTADHLKAELSRRGLKCGGTLQQRAQRLWSVRGLCSHEIPKSLRPKKR